MLDDYFGTRASGKKREAERIAIVESETPRIPEAQPRVVSFVANYGAGVCATP